MSMQEGAGQGLSSPSYVLPAPTRPAAPPPTLGRGQLLNKVCHRRAQRACKAQLGLEKGLQRLGRPMEDDAPRAQQLQYGSS